MRDKRIEILGPGRDKWRSDSEKQGGGDLGIKMKPTVSALLRPQVFRMQLLSIISHFAWIPTC